MNKINKKDKNNKDITGLNKNISEISDLKNLLIEKEKRINEEIYKNQELKEELLRAGGLLKEKDNLIQAEKNKNQILLKDLSNAQNLLKEKEKIIEEEKNQKQKSNKELKDLQNIIKDKEEKFNEERKKFGEMNKKISFYKYLLGSASQEEKMMKLFDELELKEKEIKKLNEMISRFPFELLENEKLMTIIIISGDQTVHYSIICKNTQKFTEIEHNLYQKYPEYLESENYFLTNGKKINKYRTLEENKIKNGDIITLYKYGDSE